MTVGIDAQTFVEQHFAIRALPAANKKNEVVACGKLRDVGHAVGHRTTDGVETLEDGTWGNVRLDIVDDAVELVEALGGLRIEIDVAREVELGHLVEGLYHDGIALRLSHKA